MKAVIESKKCKYKVLNRVGVYEEWSGIFKNTDKATEWYKVHGVYFEKKGFRFKLFHCYSHELNYN